MLFISLRGSKTSNSKDLKMQLIGKSTGLNKGNAIFSLLIPQLKPGKVA
jgi:hypothetical protein